MGITLKHQGAGISPLGDESGRKFGQQLAAQQRKYDLDAMQQDRNAAYDMQKLSAGYGTRRGANAGVIQPAMLGVDPDAAIEEMVASGQFYGNREMQGLLATRAKVIANSDMNLEPLQQQQALRAINTRLYANLGGMRAMPASMGQMDAPASAPSAREALRDQKVFDRYQSIVTSEAEANGEVLDRAEMRRRMEAAYNDDQAWLNGNPTAAQPAASATTAPPIDQKWGEGAKIGPWENIGDGVAKRSVTLPSGTTITESEYIDKLPKQAVPNATPAAAAPPPQNTPAKPAKKRGYIFIRPGGGGPAQAGGAVPSSPAAPQQLSPTGNPMTVDTQYEIDNPQQSPGINFFDPNNPAYAAMRGPDPAYMNPSPGHSMQQIPGGGVDFGQGPSGQNVSTRVRPGGTMAEYAPPTQVMPPVTDQWFKDRGIQQVQPGGQMVSPGESVSGPQQTRDEVANLQAVVTNPNMPEGDRVAAAKKLLSMGIGPESVGSTPSSVASSNSSSPLGPAGQAVLSAAEGKNAGRVTGDGAKASKAMKDLKDAESQKENYRPSKERIQAEKNIRSNSAFGGISQTTGAGIAAGSYGQQSVGNSLLSQLQESEGNATSARSSANLKDDPVYNMMQIKDNPTYKDLADANTLLRRTDISEEDKKEIQKWIDFHYTRMQSKPGKNKAPKNHVDQSRHSPALYPNIDLRSRSNSGLG